MIQAISSFNEKNKIQCLNSLTRITSGLRDVFKVFYDNVHGSKVKHSVWLSYVQGFYAWEAGQIVNRKLVKYPGVAASQVLFFQAIDAFIGLDRYLSDEELAHGVPLREREFVRAIERNSFRRKLGNDDTAIDREFSSMVKLLKV
jgi:hypothetical protein